MALIKPSTAQLLLIATLVDAAPQIKLVQDWKNLIKIEIMDDGGMGGFRIEFDDTNIDRHRFDNCASELRFVDEDGVEVIASLYLDRDHYPFEVDMWKTDFSQLIKLPSENTAFLLGL